MESVPELYDDSCQHTDVIDKMQEFDLVHVTNMADHNSKRKKQWHNLVVYQRKGIYYEIFLPVSLIMNFKAFFYKSQRNMCCWS